MYFPSESQCDIQSGESPLLPSFGASLSAANLQSAASVAAANSAWDSVINRSWEDFIDLGPNVAMQLRNPSGSNTPVMGTNPNGNNLLTQQGQGVTLVSTGNPAGQNPAAGGDGAKVNPVQSGLTPFQALFFQRFGFSPFRVYQGPKPKQGSVASLLYGGYQTPLLTGAGAPLPPTPTRAGFVSSSCDNPLGVSMLPVGEPFYPNGPGGPGPMSGAVAPPSGWALAIVAFLFLGAAGYLMSDEGKRKGFA